jgi:hypothetical protein
MNTKEAIDKGIGAHGMWKQRIRSAIKTGQSEWTPSVVQQDNQCEFGKWLYSCTGAEKASSHYARVKELHAGFHKSAASVLSLALAGKKAEAEAGIASGSEYITLSASLTNEMVSWKEKL